MPTGQNDEVAGAGRERLLGTLEQLLALPATNLQETLDQTSQLLGEALGIEKIDAFVYDPGTATLVALGTNDTPMARKERALGLDRLPIANGGPIVDVFLTGKPYHTGHADLNPTLQAGFTQGLGIRSMLAVAYSIAGERRGVLQADSAQPDRFTEEDLRFLQAVAQWVGMVAHRAELVEAHTAGTAEQSRRSAADEVITILAHDLRNHLTPLQGRLQLLQRRARRESLPPRYIEDFVELRLGVDRLRRLVNNLLDAARLDGGIFEVILQPVDLVALTQQSADLLQTAATPVRLHTPEELVVEADPDRLLQVLENLLANAVRYSPSGAAVDVHVEVEQRDNRAWAVVTVIDQGPGIAPELLPRLFTRFAFGYQSGGLGLGLYLARGIAEAHGGSLTVETARGQGTHFQLALPLRSSYQGS